MVTVAVTAPVYLLARHLKSLPGLRDVALVRPLVRGFVIAFLGSQVQSVPIERETAQEDESDLPGITSRCRAGLRIAFEFLSTGEEGMGQGLGVTVADFSHFPQVRCSEEREVQQIVAALTPHQAQLLQFRRRDAASLRSRADVLAFTGRVCKIEQQPLNFDRSNSPVETGPRFA